MNKRLSEYISIFGILLCIGLLLYNMAELKNISVRHDKLEKEVAQALADRKDTVRVSSQNEQATIGNGFFGGIFLDEGSISVLDWFTENNRSNYSLEKEEYLHSEPLDVKSDDSMEIPMRTYWEWEWEGPTISPEEAAQYDLVKYGYLME